MIFQKVMGWDSPIVAHRADVAWMLQRDLPPGCRVVSVVAATEAPITERDVEFGVVVEVEDSTGITEATLENLISTIVQREVDAERVAFM